jgi:hypothetical protein
VRPYFISGETIDVVKHPSLRITAEDAHLFQAMTKGLMHRIDLKLKELAPLVSDKQYDQKVATEVH